MIAKSQPKIIELVTRPGRKQAEENNNNGKSAVPANKYEVDPKLYCKIGHFHLLLEDYSKALSAYQKYFGLCKDYWRDPAFLYGLGLVYFHFNSYAWAKKAFQLVLYADAGFQRANEVHLRLGLIAKVEREFKVSLRHFRLAQEDTSPCSFDRSELQFHVAHLHEVRGDSMKAKTLYEELLNTGGSSKCEKSGEEGKSESDEGAGKEEDKKSEVDTKDGDKKCELPTNLRSDH